MADVQEMQPTVGIIGMGEVGLATEAFTFN